MLLRDRSVDVDQDRIAEGLALPVGAPELAARLGQLSGVAWLGAFLSLDDSLDLQFIEDMTRERGSWAALLEPHGYRRAGHWVVVDGVSPEGEVLIRDPRGLAYGLAPQDFLRLWRYTVLVIERRP